ncbi:uncharacterized protein LOC119582214 [Penaeus monodon]|uniref:uncharacterized protein LOC119582214 n=1 Tax=Penaeus monodon TaxID=6687 RepID=UPI0018A7DA76|nr:uncharacterized protein LOC119582214 [Penaeus monodon]
MELRQGSLPVSHLERRRASEEEGGEEGGARNHEGVVVTFVGVKKLQETVGKKPAAGLGNMTRVWEGGSPSHESAFRYLPRPSEGDPGSTWSEPPTRPSSPWSAGDKLGGWMSPGCTRGLEPVSVAPSPYIAIPYIADYRNESGTVIYSCPAITGIMASVTEQIVTCTRRPTHYEFLPITLHDCVGCTGDDSSALVTRTVSEDFRNASGSVIFTWPYLMATTDGKTHQVITCSEKPSSVFR